MDVIEITLALLLAIAVVGALAKWVPLPGPLLLVAGGVMLSFVPLLADLHIEPEIFFALFIPPLLFADGWLIPKRDLLSALRPILLLAFGLVFLTVVAIGYLMHWLIPDLPLAAAFALGAIVSPTDAVATAATTERLQVPSRITSILNGESLINDASGLVAFKFAVAAVATGFFSFVEAAEQFVLLAGGGFLAGLAIAPVRGRSDDPDHALVADAVCRLSRRGGASHVGDPGRGGGGAVCRFARRAAPLHGHAAACVGSMAHAPVRIQRPRLSIAWT